MGGERQDDLTMSLPPVAPSALGLSLKNQHFNHILRQKPRLDFFEVHAENFLSEGGNHLRFLEQVRTEYDLSIHGVGMSLGSADGLNDDHLASFKKLVDQFEPLLVSEHLAWSSVPGAYLNDLLPLPLMAESFELVSSNITRMQDTLGRRILVENPSSYLAFAGDEIPEHEFLNALADQTGCGLLLDINNVYVSAQNMGWSAEAYLSSINWSHVGEVHLAGHTVRSVDGGEIRIDDHGSPVSASVLDLYGDAIKANGLCPTLIEWDSDVPDFPILYAELERVRSIQKACLAPTRLMAGE